MATETIPTVPNPTQWHDWAQQVLDGTPITAEQGLAILRAPDEQLLDVLSGAFRIRRTYFGKKVQLYFLMNAKSGLCPEDCSYCSQSKESTADIPKYTILRRDELLAGAKAAYERQAQTYCMVISARGPSEREIQAVEQIVPEIKEKYGLHICACLGLLDDDQAQRLKACGVDRVNHNVNTSSNFYETICTTHTYEDRIRTLQSVRNAGMEVCSGGIIGMGESDEDVVRMALELSEIGVESLPVNFLIPIEGATLTNINTLTPNYCLKSLALYRYANPQSEIRIAGGRELHLGHLQPLGLYAANSVFVGDYLTTEGQAAESDYAMIRQMGFEVSESALETNAPAKPATP